MWQVMWHLLHWPVLLSTVSPRGTNRYSTQIVMLLYQLIVTTNQWQPTVCHPLITNMYWYSAVAGPPRVVTRCQFTDDIVPMTLLLWLYLPYSCCLKTAMFVCGLDPWWRHQHHPGDATGITLGAPPVSPWGNIIWCVMLDKLFV